MTDLKPLSYSGYSRYMSCPRYAQYHDSGLRPIRQSSALSFGSAVDDMINALLENQADPWEAFLAAWDINDLSNVEWDREDFDADLLEPSHADNLLGTCRSIGYKGDSLEALGKGLFKKISEDGYDALSDNQKSVLKILCHACLAEKAKLFLESYKKYIMPQIEEVESVQKQIELANGRILGISDYVAKVKGHGRVLLDNKTSKRSYARDAVKSSGQLALYAAALDCDKAGFVVMVKGINKNTQYVCQKCGFDGASHQHKSCPNTVDGERCRGDLDKFVKPKAYVQMMIDDVPKWNKLMVIQAMQDVDELRQAGFYPRNLTACNWMYGKPCPYKAKCWENKDDGLEDKNGNTK